MLYANKNLVANLTKLTLNLEIFVIGWRPRNYHFMLPRLGTPAKLLNWSTEGKRPEIRSNCSNRPQIPPRQHTIVLLSIHYLASKLLCAESESKVANLCNLNFPVWSHRLRLGLNSALPLKDSDTAWDSNYSHSGWETVSCSRWHNRKTTGARERLPFHHIFISLNLAVYYCYFNR